MHGYFAASDLLMAFGTMRNDDFNGALTKTLAFGRRGLALKLRRTKVSGAGRKTTWLTIYVDRHMTQAESDWMVELEELARTPAIMWPRDYWLPLPTSDLTGAICEPV